MTRVLLDTQGPENAVQVVSVWKGALNSPVTVVPEDYKGIDFPIYSPDGFLKQFALV